MVQLRFCLHIDANDATKVQADGAALFAPLDRQPGLGIALNHRYLLIVVGDGSGGFLCSGLLQEDAHAEQRQRLSLS